MVNSLLQKDYKVPGEVLVTWGMSSHNSPGAAHGHHIPITFPAKPTDTLLGQTWRDLQQEAPVPSLGQKWLQVQTHRPLVTTADCQLDSGVAAHKNSYKARKGAPPRGRTCLMPSTC